MRLHETTPENYPVTAASVARAREDMRDQLCKARALTWLADVQDRAPVCCGEYGNCMSKCVEREGK